MTATLATNLVQLKPFDPEPKGVVERANGFLETSFLPGWSVASSADLNAQLIDWLRTRTGEPFGRCARPAEVMEADLAGMLPLPPIAPIFGRQSRVSLGRDYFVRIAGSDYSVDSAALGRMVEATADLEPVVVRRDGRLVAKHARSWASAATIIDLIRIDVAGRLRAAFQQARSVDDPLTRALALYDAPFGFAIDGQVA